MSIVLYALAILLAIGAVLSALFAKASGGPARKAAAIAAAAGVVLAVALAYTGWRLR